MKNNQIEDILTLLAIVVLIDERTRPPEVDAFGRQYKQIHDVLRVDTIMTEETAIHWFHENKARLLLVLSGQGRTEFTQHLLEKLVNHPQKIRIYDAMIRIAYSDAEYHDSENSLIKRASKLWGV